jgi:crotonobetainyl-CoA:carnitine CoA-transferase CaiB-like acyl-CoA transferase
MRTDNVFSGPKVVDFARFIAGISAAVIRSDFGADVVKWSRRRAIRARRQSFTKWPIR